MPGANAPASEVVGLNVNADVTDPTTTFIFSTPEPGSLPLLANGAAVSFAAWRLRRQTAAHAA